MLNAADVLLSRSTDQSKSLPPKLSNSKFSLIKLQSDMQLRTSEAFKNLG